MAPSETDAECDSYDSGIYDPAEWYVPIRRVQLPNESSRLPIAILSAVGCC